MVITGDITDPAFVESLFADIEKQWGPVSVLVANAGAGVSASVVRTTDEDWQRMLDLNLTAPFRCIRRVMPSMIEAGFGRVFVVASVAAKISPAEDNVVSPGSRTARSRAIARGSRRVTRSGCVPGRFDRLPFAFVILLEDLGERIWV